MTAYINTLQKFVESEKVKHDEAHEVAKQAAQDRLTPLETRLEKLLATIPVEIQAEGLSLSVLQKSLKGRWKGTCHPGELGTALRKLGYVRKRNWSDGNGFRALWFKV